MRVGRRKAVKRKLSLAPVTARTRPEHAREKPSMSERDPQGGAQRPGVVIVEEHMARRLGRAAALSARWRVLPLESYDSLSRVQRAERPTLVLLAVDPARPTAATRAAQRAKSELSPPRVGLLCHGRVDDPAALVLACGADGWLGGEANEATLNAWVAQVMRGERPITQDQAPRRGLLGRLFGR